jgi:hypothetical protein
MERAMAGSRRPRPMAIQHLTRPAAYTTPVEDSEDRYTSEAWKGRLHCTKGIPFDITPPND